MTAACTCAAEGIEDLGPGIPPSAYPALQAQCRRHGAAKCLIGRCERQAASTGLCVPCDRFYRVVLADDRFRSERPTPYDPRSGQMVLC